MNRNTIIHTPKEEDRKSFVLDRAVPQDDSLTWEARGVLCYLLSKPSNWRVMIEDLQQNCGRDKVYRILNELKDAGYIQREFKNPKTGKFDWGPYIVRESPSKVVGEIGPSPFPENPEMATRTEESSPFPEKPYMVFQEIKEQSLSVDQLSTESQQDTPDGVQPVPISEHADQAQATPTPVEEPLTLPVEQGEHTPPPLPPPPSPYQLMFLSVMEHIFGVTDPDELAKLDGKKKFRSRAGMIASWLCGKAETFTLGNSKKTVELGFISRPADPDHVRLFAGAYKASNSGVDLPWDIEKFVDHWRKWASSRKPKVTPINQGESTERQPLTPEQVEEIRVAKEAMKSRQRASGE